MYVELFGNCVLYSLNYDRMLTDAVSLRAGFMYLASARETIMMIPLMASYLFGSGNHKVELGAGLLVTNGPAEATEIASGFALGPWGSVWGTAVVGYRYAPREGGFLFRAGFTPTFNVLPLFGVSVGYAF